MTRKLIHVPPSAAYFNRPSESDVAQWTRDKALEDAALAVETFLQSWGLPIGSYAERELVKAIRSLKGGN